MAVDGIDIKIPERGPSFSSHKFAKKSGFRYEVATCILSGDICWISGPYPAGSWPDINIFRNGLKTYLEPYERVEADDGYLADAPTHVRCPKDVTTKPERKKMMAIVRMRHETMNRRLKQWRILKSMYRHELKEHRTVFSAVAVMTQIAISHGEPLFSVEYSDNIDVSDDEEENMHEEEEGVYEEMEM